MFCEKKRTSLDIFGLSVGQFLRPISVQKALEVPLRLDVMSLTIISSPNPKALFASVESLLDSLHLCSPRDSLDSGSSSGSEPGSASYRVLVMGATR